MTDGLNLTGFNETKAGDKNSIDAGYAANPGSAFPASDVSTQGAAGTTDKMVNTAAETSGFGTGNN
jgi:hypothetical protein